MWTPKITNMLGSWLARARGGAKLEQIAFVGENSSLKLCWEYLNDEDFSITCGHRMTDENKRELTNLHESSGIDVRIVT
jgi:hypothetical protein